jgi:pilus assembly protein CpaF
METMVMMASQNIPDRVIRQMLVSAIHIVVQCARLTDGTRKVISISEVNGIEDDHVEMNEVFHFERTGVGARGRTLGVFRGCGQKPLSSDRLKAYGIHLPASIFNETHEVKDK